MKKTFLYLLTTVMSISLLTSCLGDNESTSAQQNAYGVIGKEGTTTYAKLWYLELTSESLNEYNTGDVVFLDYEINHGNYTTLPSSNMMVFNAVYARPTSENLVFRSSEHLTVNETSADLNPENKDALTSIGLEGLGHRSSKYFMDRWLINYQAKYTREQTASIELIYDAQKQVDERGEPLPENTYIIDVRLNITGTPNTGSESTNKENRVVANFSRLRSLLAPREIADNGTLVNIRLRYFKEDANTNIPVLTLTETMGYLDYPKE